MSSSQTLQITPRVIPNIPNDNVIVRCSCPLRLPSGQMIQCTKCNCYSHKKCVRISDPFICDFCHYSNQYILEASFDSNITPNGSVIQLFALKDALIEQFTPIEICEIREHTIASGQVGALLDHIMIYFNDLEGDLNRLKVFCQHVAKDEYKQQIDKEIEEKATKYRELAALAAELKENWDESEKSYRILSYFRDAVCRSLI